MTRSRSQIVSERAYALWEAEGRHDGNDQAHWLQAEAEISSEPAPGEVSGTCPWLEAALEDLIGLDIDSPIASSAAADASELSDHYRNAFQALSSRDESEGPAARIWSILWAITGMYFKPVDLNEPFGPMLVLANGDRSAIPADFREHVDILETMARATSNVVLRTRLCDLTWLLDRKRVWAGVAAITEYADLVRAVECKTLMFRNSTGEERFYHEIA